MTRSLLSRVKATRLAAVLTTAALCAGVTGVAVATAAGAGTEAPKNVTAVASAAGSSVAKVTVSWDAPSDSTLGDAIVTLDGQADQSVDPDERSVEFTGIVAGEYAATVTFHTSDGTPSAPEPAWVTVPVGPEAPTGVIGHADGTGVTVSWTPGDATADTFHVTLQGHPAKDVSSPSATFTGITPGTYAISVIAKNTGGTSPVGGGTVVVTGATKPGAPQNVSTSQPANRSVAVKWDAPASTGGAAISAYHVTVSFPSGSGCGDGNGGTKVCSYTNDTPLDGPARSTVFYGLPKDQGSYVAAVSATNSVGEGPATSSGPHAMVLSSVASAPDDVTASSTSANKVTVTWAAPDNGGQPITNYAVALTQKLFGIVDGDARTITLSGVPAGSYTAKVFAYNANGPSSAATATVTVASAGAPPAVVVPPAVTPPAVDPPTAPSAPRTLATKIPSKGTVVTAWTAPASVNGSKVIGYIVTFAGQEKRLAGTRVAFGSVTKGTWALKVVAVNAAGKSVAATKLVTVTAANASRTKLTLKVGLRGTDVKKLQAALRMPLKARTGTFGADTRAKVLAWQKAKRVRQTGVANHTMRTALKV